MSKKRIDYTTSDGVKAWIKAAGFSSDVEAASHLGIPFRTFCRYKAEGLPMKHGAAVRSSEYVIGLMEEILAERKKDA